jgi:hypothetical protein
MPLYENATSKEIVAKVNEVIRVLNALHGDYDLHYHETLDTHYNTSYPKVRVDE